MRRQPFTAFVHAILVVLMLTGFVLIGQQLEATLYKAGLIILTASTILQIAFGNIPSHFDFRHAMRLFWPFMGIILTVFILGYTLTPLLYALGR